MKSTVEEFDRYFTIPLQLFCATKVLARTYLGQEDKDMRYVPLEDYEQASSTYWHKDTLLPGHTLKKPLSLVKALDVNTFLPQSTKKAQ